jgi:hypothetical protein
VSEIVAVTEQNEGRKEEKKGGTRKTLSVCLVEKNRTKG